MDDIGADPGPGAAPLAAQGGLDNEQIRSRIFEAIVNHRIAPGMHLKEDVLCDVYGIGRTRVRAILGRLAADHVIELVTNRGAFVSTPTVEEAREVFRARRLIEGHLVQRVAENHGAGVRSVLEAHLDREQTARSAGDHSIVIRRCASFHRLLAEQADSPVMTRFVRELIARSALIVAVYEAKPPDECEFAEHRALTDLILAGRGEEAVRLMENHLQGIEDRLDLRPRRASTNDLRVALHQNYL